MLKKAIYIYISMMLLVALLTNASEATADKIDVKIENYQIESKENTPVTVIEAPDIGSAQNITGGNTNGGNTNGGNTSGGNPNGGNTNGGNTSGGNTSGGDISGGNTSGGNISGGNTSGGDTSGGNTSGGDTSGGNTSGGDTSGGNTSGGNTSGRDTNGGNTSGGDTDGGNTSGGDTDGGNTSGGNISGGNISGGNTSGGNASDGNTQGQATKGEGTNGQNVAGGKTNGGSIFSGITNYLGTHWDDIKDFGVKVGRGVAVGVIGAGIVVGAVAGIGALVGATVAAPVIAAGLVAGVVAGTAYSFISGSEFSWGKGVGISGSAALVTMILGQAGAGSLIRSGFTAARGLCQRSIDKVAGLTKSSVARLVSVTKPILDKAAGLARSGIRGLNNLKGWFVAKVLPELTVRNLVSNFLSGGAFSWGIYYLTEPDRTVEGYISSIVNGGVINVLATPLAIGVLGSRAFTQSRFSKTFDKAKELLKKIPLPAAAITWANNKWPLAVVKQAFSQPMKLINSGIKKVFTEANPSGLDSSQDVIDTPVDSN